MELRGDFESYAEILDLLQIITMGKKSGEVNLRNDEESITIFFKDGKTIDFNSNVPSLKRLRERVEKGELSLEEAIDFLLHHVAMWDKGRFLFKEAPVSREGIGTADTLNIMMNFTKEEDELPKEVREAIKQNVRFVLSEEANLPATIGKEDWRILVAICRGLPIWDAILQAGHSFSEDTKTVAFLIKHSLIKPKSEEEIAEEGAEEEKGEEVSTQVPEIKLEKVRELLVETMGPMGEFLVEETLEELELSKLPTDLIPNFVEALLEKIPDSCLVDGEKCRDRLRDQIFAILKGGANEA